MASEKEMFGQVFSQMTSGLPTMVNGLLIVMLLGVVALIAVVVWIKLSYKHKVIIRDIVNGGKVIKEDMAKEWTDDRGVKYWKLKKEPSKDKRLISFPPSTSIDRTTKGKLFHEVYWLEGVGYIPIHDTVALADIPSNLFTNIPEEITDIEEASKREDKIKQWKDKRLKEWMKEKNIDYAFSPLGSDQRVALVNNIRKGEERRGKSWLENMPLYAGLTALVIIVVALLIFYKDIAQPVIDSKKLDVDIMKTLDKVTERMERMEKDVQQIESNNPSQTPPN